MFFADLNFFMSHLKKHPTVQKLWRHFSQKEKLIKSLLAFIIVLICQLVLKKIQW